MEFEGEKHEVVLSNLSVGGAQVSWGNPIEKDKEIILFVRVGEKVESLNAIVRWKSDSAFGVQFVSMKAKQVWMLQQWLRQLTP